MTINWKFEIESYLKKERHNGKGSQTRLDSVFSPSQVGVCIRQAVKEKLGLKTYTVDSLARFEVGKLIHAWLRNRPGSGKCEFELEVNLELDGICFHGFADAFDGGTVYEFKSTSDISKVAQFGAFEPHVRQLTIYLKALNIQKGELVYISKSKVNDVLQIPLPYSEQKMQEVLTFCKSVVKAIEKHRKTKELPPKCNCIDCKFETTE